MSASVTPPVDGRMAESIALLDAIGPLLTGKDHVVIISVLSALIRTVAVRAFLDRGIAVSKLMEIVMRHAQPREIDLQPHTRH